MLRFIPKLHPAHYLFVAVIAIGALFPAEISNGLSASIAWFEHQFGWLVLLACVFFVGFSVYVAFGPYGHLRLGGPDEEPQFSRGSWLAMLFAAGMGAGLVFYGAAEPLLHFMNPPPSMKGIFSEAETARRAMVITYFHWGIHAWAIYAMAALSIAYFTFHRHRKLLPSAPITDHPLGRAAVDSFAILAVVFGLVASLSQGVLQVSDGAMRFTGAIAGEHGERNYHLIVLVILFMGYMASASTGLGKGIKVLSDINVTVAIVLMLFILFAGPTHFIMESFVSGIGDYLDRFVFLSFNVRHFSDPGGWTESWTITYFLWWISWAPFVGVFIARISRGRTLKEFICGVILVPTVFSAFWFATLGGTSLHLEMFDQPGFGHVVENLEQTTYALLGTMQYSDLTTGVVVLLLFIFLVTSADSGTYVLGMFTADGALVPPVRQRLFWGVVVGLATAAALMATDSILFLRSIAAVGAIPYLFIMLWQCYALWKAMKEDLLEERR